jgi:hypothetical protein
MEQNKQKVLDYDNLYLRDAVNFGRTCYLPIFRVYLS